MIITIIHGQSHKGSTYHITKQIADKIGNSETKVNEFFLPDDGPDMCKGCFQCIVRGEEFCPHAEQVMPIVRTMEEADVIIVDSPTYCIQMTGALKVFFDHLAYMWMSHRPHKVMYDKIGIVISTAAGAGASEVTKLIAKQLFWMGVTNIYRVPVRVGAMSWDQVDEKNRHRIDSRVDVISHKVRRRLKSGRRKVGIKMRFLFPIMGISQKNNTWNPIDRTHWIENGWLKGKRPWKE